MSCLCVFPPNIIKIDKIFKQQSRKQYRDRSMCARSTFTLTNERKTENFPPIPCVLFLNKKKIENLKVNKFLLHFFRETKSIFIRS